MSGISDIFTEIIDYFVNLVFVIFSPFSQTELNYLIETNFNIYLFSDKGWFNQPIPVYQIIVIVVSTFVFIFLLRLLWKGTKKFINMIFGVFTV